MSKQIMKYRLGRGLMIFGLIFSGESAMSLEQPEYAVLYTDGNIEYRQYESYLVSDTIVEDADDFSEAGNEGFRRLFRYITGSNQSQAKIAMTAPVAQAPASEKIAMTAPVQQNADPNGWRVSFMLPSEYTMENVPEPLDHRVKIRAVPAKLMAVLRYSGRWTERNFERKQSALLAAIDEESVSPIGKMQRALYNPPYTPPFMRRNEVMVEVDGLPEVAEQTADNRLVAY
jgi:hypothetical protein